MNDTNFLNMARNDCVVPDESFEDPRINRLRNVSYGIIMPTIILFGIIGNVLNLIVLSRRNMQGTAYIYMRGYSLASLLAIVFCIPFTLRVLLHESTAGWGSYPQALYHVHLELYLGNGCLGVGVMMLLALTLERHASVCRPGQYGRPVCGPPRLTVHLLSLGTFLAYLPGVFSASVRRCRQPSGRMLFQKRDNLTLLQSPAYQVYKVILEVVFKIGPTLLLAVLNLRIVLAYKRTCERRRRMRRQDGRVSFAEERRLVLLLGSTSLLFLICVSPMVILNVTLNEDNLSIFSYQVFRALANLLEVINYSMSFYIYCLFSEDFRATLRRTFERPRGPAGTRRGGAQPRGPADASSDPTRGSSRTPDNGALCAPRDTKPE